MDLRRISVPLTREQKLGVVTLQEAKAQERVLHSFEDELISGYIEKAFDHLHGRAGWLNGYCLLEEEFEFFPGAIYATTELPLRPLEDEAGVTVERRLGRGDYAAFGSGDFMVVTQDEFGVIARLTTTGFAAQVGVVDPREYRVRFKAGWPDADLVPSPLKHAILLLVGHWYQNREATIGDPKLSTVSKKLEFGLMELAGRYRVSPDHS